MDYDEHHPTVLDKCGHIICNKCKMNSVSYRDEASGFDNVVCPVQECNKLQDNYSKHNANLS